MYYPNPVQNTLLANLPKDARERLSFYLEPVQMRSGDILIHPGVQSQYVYFPVSSSVSLINVLEDGSEIETSMVGNEGMVSIAHILSEGIILDQAIVTVEGYGFQLKAQLLHNEFDRSMWLRQLLLRYAQALMTETSQRSICNRFHSVHQRLCSWLLTAIDRTPSNHLIITQGSVANLLGVRREGITAAACQLQDAGLIHNSRGNITVLDRPGLEAEACECYTVIKKEFDRLLLDRQAPNIRTTQYVRLFARHSTVPEHSNPA